MVEIRVIVLPGGKLQIFVDGDLSEEQAVNVTKALAEKFGTVIAGGITFTSAIEGHKAGNLQHAHVTGEVNHG